MNAINNIIIDGHCDSVLLAAGYDSHGNSIEAIDLCKKNTSSHIDIPRLITGSVTAQFFALFTDTQFVEKASEHTYMLLETIEKIFSNCASIKLALSASDVSRARENNTVAAFLTIEGGEAIGQSLDNLRAFYNRGIRLMGLTWNRKNAIARGAAEPGPDGLTPFGKSVIQEMEKLGMIVDVSHLCDEALSEVLAVAERPLVASHSNARSICEHRRNLTDKQIEAIAKTGGLIGVTFVGGFIDKNKDNVNIDRLIDHIDHIVKIAGIDYVGFGSDFDGFTMPPTILPDCSYWPSMIEALTKRGYTGANLQKIMGANWLRVISDIVG